MPRKLISRGCMIFNCDRRHGNFCCYDCGYRTTKGAFRCNNPCQTRRESVAWTFQPDKGL